MTEQRNKPLITFVVELPFIIAVAFLLAWAVKIWIVQPFFIPTGSMEPTLISKDQVLVNRFIFRLSDPSFGDIIVFKYPIDPKKDFIKRVVATPGHVLELKDGQIYLDRHAMTESYIEKTNDTSNYGPIRIPPGKIFVMGDNRANSFDSRVFGLVPIENVKGRAFCIYWPISRMRRL